MAEIDIERRRNLAWFPWILGALLLLVVVGVTWYLAGPDGGRGGTGADIDTLETRPYVP